jgi:glycosyltransferase involved in cell wall biosynthesis
MGEVLDAATRAQPSGRLFTVGIPVFNGRSLLRNCLQSVIDSTLSRDRFEIVIADDGSSEPETLAILGEFEKSLAADPGFFRVISLGTNSGGAARPRNRILDEATGEYVFFVDSDDTIGDLALERIAEAVAVTPADWIAVNQVPVNGRGALCVVRQSQAEVPRTKALTTLTVHKVFRRAEIERQQLRFDEGLSPGEDVSFAFSYIANAARFLMLGGYDYYYLTQHGGNPNEPAHLSRRANTPETLIEKDEWILRSMLTALRKSNLPESERRQIISRVVLPRVLISHGYLKAIVNAGPVAGTRALRRLSKLLADPLVADLDPAELKEVTEEHLAKIAKSDWAGLTHLVSSAAPHPHSRSVDAELSSALCLIMESLQTLSRLVAPAPERDGDLVEVARGRPYKLSSAYGTSSRTGVVQARSSYFFHTGFGKDQSIRVDLGRRRRVRRIEVTNRQGGFQERAKHIFAVLTDDRAGEGVRQVFPMYKDGGAWQECGIAVPDVSARYVTITSPMDTALHFSDLRIYAADGDRPTEPTPRWTPRRVLRGVKRRSRRLSSSR